MFKLSLVFIIMVLVSCGKPTTTQYPEKLQGFSKSQSIVLGTVEEENFNQQIKDNNVKHKNIRPSRFLDLDKDGIVDAYDFDIDNDGINNIIDSAPFDSLKGSEDIDVDSIPDFVDFDSSPLFSDLSNDQESIYDEFGITITSSTKWSTEDISTVLNNININKHLIKKLNSLAIINLSSVEKLRSAEYNKEWKTITIFPNKLANRPKEIHSSFTHELFHVVENDYPELFQQFVKISPWSIEIDSNNMSKYTYIDQNDFQHTFTDEELRFDYLSNIRILGNEITPTMYSLQGPQEHFAEAGLATVIYDQDLTGTFSTERFIHLNEFYKTKMYQLLSTFLRQ